MKKALLLSSFLLLSFFGVYAQERIVTGRVTSTEDGTPLPGHSRQAKRFVKTSEYLGLPLFISVRYLRSAFERMVLSQLITVHCSKR
ncbi:MAG: hypothetical protein ACK5OS_16220, partial [Chryseotalea sp.]